MMNVSIIGTGYVGLVTGVCLAQKGHRVTCVDVDRQKVGQINCGDAPFHEPGLRELLRRNLGRRFTATEDLARSVLDSDATIIAVGTPFRDGRIDLSFVRNAARQIGLTLAHKKRYHVVAVKSTVVPGTTDTVVLPILEETSRKRGGIGFGLGVNPEFLSEGEAVHDFMQPDRIVLGGIDDRSIAALEELYAPFKAAPVLRTGTRTAEMIKYTSNALLTALISFSNEIGGLCSAVGGIDCAEVMHGVHLSHYLSARGSGGRRVDTPITAFLQAGCGFGGSCLPKDVKALIARGNEVGCAMTLLQQVIRINLCQPQRMVDLLRLHFSSLRSVPVAVLGLAFKPGTDDLRESPAIPLVKLLLDAGARVRLYDPVAMPAARRAGLFAPNCYAKSLHDSLALAKAALVVTAWPEFRRLETLPLERRRSLVVVDGRHLLNGNRFACYEAIGRGAPAGPDGKVTLRSRGTRGLA